MDDLTRGFEQLLERASGPLNIRLLRQTLMAVTLTLRAGWKHAVENNRHTCRYLQPVKTNETGTA
jgi:hypothetical protein